MQLICEALAGGLLVLNNEGRARRLLETLWGYVDSRLVSDDIAANLIMALADLGDVFDESSASEEERSLDIPTTQLVMDIINQVIFRYGPESKPSYAIEEAAATSSKSLLIPILMCQKYLAGSADARRFMNEKIATWAADGRLLKHPRICAILNYWEQIADRDNKEIADFMEKVVEDDDALIHYLCEYVRIKPSSGMDYYEQRQVDANIDQLKGRFSLPFLVNKLIRMTTKKEFRSRPDEEKSVIYALIQAIYAGNSS